MYVAACKYSVAKQMLYAHAHMHGLLPKILMCF